MQNQQNQENQDKASLDNHLQQIGRDGAYVEVSAGDLATTDLSQAKMIVIKDARWEITDPFEVEAFRQAWETIRNGDGPAEVRSFGLLLRLLKCGLKKC